MKSGRNVDQMSYNLTAGCRSSANQSLLMADRTFGSQTFHIRISKSDEFVAVCDVRKLKEIVSNPDGKAEGDRVNF